MKTTDQRAGEAVARAVIMRCVLVLTKEGECFADEGEALLGAPVRDWPAIAAWNKRACAYLFELEVARRR